MKCLLVICEVVICIAANIQDEANYYFNSDLAKIFERKWKAYEKMYESTIEFTLQDSFGHNSMNVYINRYQDPLALGAGYYHNDNQVQLVLETMVLESLPTLSNIQVSFPLHRHLLLVEADVSKMIVHTNYAVFRNESDIILASATQDSSKDSPFRFQQVRNVGALAITVDGCSFSGAVVATLSGDTVSLGHHRLTLTECQYTVEIYQANTNAPPVIANYLPNGDSGLNLDHLLLRPLTEELMPKLRAAMISDVNTTSVFHNDLTSIRSKQSEVFDRTGSTIDNILRSINQKTLENNMGKLNLNDFAIVWDEKFPVLPEARSAIILTDVLLLGVDTIYASHAGGPVRLTDLEILEQLRFGTLQVVGKIWVKGLIDSSEFAVEIRDFAFDITIDSDNQATFEANGWRFLEFSCPGMEFFPTESLVIGYLQKELPERLKLHLKSVYDEAKFSQSKINHRSNDNRQSDVYITKIRKADNLLDNTNTNKEDRTKNQALRINPKLSTVHTTNIEVNSTAQFKSKDYKICRTHDSTQFTKTVKDKVTRENDVFKNNKKNLENITNHAVETHMHKEQAAEKARLQT